MLTCPDIEDLSENIHVIFITPKSPLALQIEFVMNQKRNERELPTKPNGEEQNTPLYNLLMMMRTAGENETFYFNNPKSVHA